MKSYDILRTARLLVVAVAVLVTQALAMPQTNNFVAEASIDAIPLDLEVTPNGKVAVVRGNIPGDATANDQKLSIWRTDTGAQVLPNPINTVGKGNLIVKDGLPMFGDAVAVTNSRVVAIGSHGAVPSVDEDTIYVDILELRYSGGGVNAIVLAAHELTVGGSNPLTKMGLAHDVAVTPDGGMAAVTHANWVHFFELATGSLVGGVNLGSFGATACAPFYSRSSVELTNTRAIVTTGRITAGFQTNTEVFVLDLEIDPPVVRLHDVLPPLAARDFGPHDLAILPDGLRAVVTSTGYVAMYDLANNATLGRHVGALDTRRWNLPSTPQTQSLWDSLEVSNTRAVVLSNRLLDPGGGAPLQQDGWGLVVLDLSLPLSQQSLFSAAAGNDADPGWDVALASDGLMVTVKTELHDMALLDVVSPATSSFLRIGPSPNLTPVNSSSGAFGVNDATLLLAPTGSDPVQRWAAFVGRPDPLPSNKVIVRFYDLAAGSFPIPASSWLKHYDLQEATPTNELDSADLALTASGTDVIVRLTAPLNDHATAGGVDWSRWGSSPPVPAGLKWGGQGKCVGADSLKLGRGKAVSISRDTTPGSTAGWIHIVTVQ